MKTYITKIKKLEETIKNRINKENEISTIEEFIKLVDNEELEVIAYTLDGEVTNKALLEIIESHDIEPKLKKELLRLFKEDEEEYAEDNNKIR